MTSGNNELDRMKSTRELTEDRAGLHVRHDGTEIRDEIGVVELET